MKAKKCVVLSVVGLVVLAGAAWGGCHLYERHIVKKATQALEKGFSAVAAELLEKYRTCLVSNPDDCKLLINTYYSDRWTQRLNWASQACLNSGVEIVETYVGLSAAMEMEGRSDDALRVLGSVVEKFPETPELFYRMARILMQKENHAQAMVAFQQAMQKAPNNNQIALEAMDYFARLKEWSAARPIADKLKAAQTDNPAVKLVIARIYKNSGDQSSFEAALKEAQTLLDKSPNKKSFEDAFKDVLGKK